MSSECLFCQIATGLVQSESIFSDSESVAFLDHRPLFPGHTLLIPRQHFETLADLPPDRIGPLFRTARLLARVVETTLGAEGSFVAINNRVSQSVAHLHIHVVPRTRGDGLRGFFWPRHSYDGPEHREEIRARLHTAMQSAVELQQAPDTG